jgi:hypothetical protein
MKTDLYKLGSLISMDVRPFDLESVVSPMSPGIERDKLVDFAIASGACLGYTESVHVDFRRDFQPYQGRKLMLENALKTLSICATVMFLALGLFFQFKVFKQNSYNSRLNEKFQQQYTTVVLHPTKGMDPLQALRSELANVRQVKHGQNENGQVSVTTMLTYVLEVLSSTKSDVKIDTVKIGSKNVIITGDTGDRNSTIAFFNAIDAHKALKTSQNSDEFKAGRDRFQVTILPKGR